MFIYHQSAQQTQLGNTTNYAYDDLNRLTRVSQSVGGTQLNTDYAYDIWEGSYIRNSVMDANGNQDVQGASGHYLSFIYDALGNPLSETVTKQGDSNITFYEYDSVNHVIQYTQGFGGNGLDISYSYNARQII